MDEQQLKKMLSDIKAPAPGENAQNQALNAALAAFDKNLSVANQDTDDEDRLTDIGSTSNVRRFFMDRYQVTGMGRMVAMTAVVALLAGGYFTFFGKEEVLNQSIVGSAADTKQVAGQETNDPEYQKKVDALNKKSAEIAKQTGQSALPVPLAPSESQKLELPSTPAPPQGDQLAEWRAKTEAKRLQMESEQAPKEADATASGAAQPSRQLAATPAPALTYKMMSQNITRDHEAGKGNVLADKLDESGLRKDRMAQTKRPEEKAAIINNLAPGQNAPAAQVPASAAGGMIAPADIAVMPAPPPVAQPAPGVMRASAPYYQDEGRDSFPDYEDNPVTSVASSPVSTFSIDVDTSSYSFVRRMVNGGQLPPKGAVRLEELINYFPYSYAVPGKDEDPFRPTVAVYKCPWNAEHKIVHIGIKGYEMTDDKPKSNIVLLLDTSGSMNSPDRLPLVVSAFKLMLDSLKPDDMVSIVTYAGYAGVALEPTPASDKQKIIDTLNNLSASGSTAGSEGIRTAYNLAEQHLIKGGNNRILLATDGDFNVGISSQDELKSFIVKKRDEGIFLSVLGVGQGNYHDNTMQTLAQNGNGNASYIDNLSEARKVLVEEAGSTLFTIAKDVKLQVEFNPAQVQEYRLLGYETRHLNREDFNNDKIDAGEIGAGHAVTAIYEITPVGATPVVDDLRYTAKEKALPPKADADGAKFSNEIAFLKIRYKKPDGDTSKLMTRPITEADEKSFDALPDDIRFAAAVAGFGQLLRDSQYTSALSWDQVINMANNARGKDEFGYRAEFVNLARLAKSEEGGGGSGNR